MTPVLELVEVSKQYPGHPPVRALDGVTLSINRHDLVGIVGASGSGKSTLMNVVGALARPTSGTVRLEGHDVTSLSDGDLSGLRATRIGFVFQQFHLLAGLSATDNVATGLVYRGVGLSHRRAAAVESLKRVGLGHRLGHRPSQMSGGERQRVAIARALVGDPALILADEPTGNLDSRTGEAILELLMGLNDEGATIVVITHDRGIARRLPRCIEMADGQIVNQTLQEVSA